MDAWKKMIIEGNQSFNTGRFYSAENYYKLACSFACDMCPHSSKCSDIIASLVVSYQNLAELYFNNDQTQQGLSQYQTLYEKLLEFSRHYQQSPEVLALIQQAIRKVGTELLFITKKKEINSPQSQQVIRHITHTEKTFLH